MNELSKKEDFKKLFPYETLLLNNIFNENDNYNFKIIERENKLINCNGYNEEININYDYLNEISDGDFDFQKELVTIFLKEIPIQISKLKTANENFAFKEIHILSHSIKTSFSMIGIEILKDKFISLENLVKNIEFENNSEIKSIVDYEYFTSLKIKINQFNCWLTNEFDALFNQIEKKVSEKYLISYNDK